MSGPVSVHDTDAQLEALVRRQHRFRVLSTTVLGVILLIAVLTLASVVNSQRAQLARSTQAECALFTTLGSQAPTILPGQVRGSRYGTGLVLSMHRTALSLHCPSVPPVPQEVIDWAVYYHLPL